MMEEKLDALYKFLKANLSYNRKLQEKEYQKILCPHGRVNDKVVSLLYNIVNSQSQPKIDNLAKFFQKLSDNYDKLGSFSEFATILGCNREARYMDIYNKLKENSGWGPKTAALFTKVLYNIHCGSYASELKLWSDAPEINDTDRIYLPVDAVILFIFSRLGYEKPSFSSINKILNDRYDPSEMVNWDDLWFWGFINQKGSARDRKLEWNENKYWALEHSNKESKVIEEIKSKSTEFREILG